MTDATVHITEALLDVLLEHAEDAEPQRTTVRLAVTPAGDLGLEGLAPETPVFSDLYLPAAGGSVEAVFGVDVSVPPGQTPGVFVSHPTGPLDLTSQDDFAERIVVAVPPWTTADVAVFDRRGRELVVRIHELPETVDV